jgi:lipid A disaccharide synthetase
MSDIQIKGMAGERMFEAGCVQLWDKNLANVMGFSEVLKKLPASTNGNFHQGIICVEG